MGKEEDVRLSLRLDRKLYGKLLDAVTQRKKAGEHAASLNRIIVEALKEKLGIQPTGKRKR